MSWLNKQKYTRKKYHEAIKQGKIPGVLHSIKRMINTRISLWWNDRSQFRKEFQQIEKTYYSSRTEPDYQKTAEAVGALLNFMDKLDQTRSNLRLLWIPISFILLSFFGFYLNQLFEGKPDPFQCNGSDKASCAILVAPFGGTQNDINEAIFSIISKEKEEWYTVHSLSAEGEERDQYSFLENEVYGKCNPRIMIYGQGNEGTESMDVDLKLFSLEFPLKESLDIEDAQYFNLSSFSQQNLEKILLDEGLLTGIESYLIRLCDQPLSSLKSSVEAISEQSHNPELMSFMYENAAEAFWSGGEAENAEKLLSLSIRSDKKSRDAYAMRGLMRDEIGKNFPGAFEDYSRFLEMSQQNHTVRKRRFYSVQNHYQKNDRSLPPGQKTSILLALENDYRIISSLQRGEDQDYLNELGSFLKLIKSSTPRAEFNFKGIIRNFQEVKDKNLSIRFTSGTLDLNKTNGEFVISSSEKANLLGKIVLITAEGYKSIRFIIREHQINSGNAEIILLKKIDSREVETLHYTLCPYSTKSRWILINLETDKKILIRRASFSTEDMEQVRYSLELNGELVKYDIKKQSDQSAILYVYGGLIEVKPYYRRRLLSEKANVSLVLVKNDAQRTTTGIHNLTHLPEINPEGIERFNFKWNEDRESYVHNSFNFSRICEIQQNKWKAAILVTYGQQNFKPVEIKDWDAAIAKNELILNLEN